MLMMCLPSYCHKGLVTVDRKGRIVETIVNGQKICTRINYSNEVADFDLHGNLISAFAVFAPTATMGTRTKLQNANSPVSLSSRSRSPDKSSCVGLCIVLIIILAWSVGMVLLLKWS